MDQAIGSKLMIRSIYTIAASLCVLIAGEAQAQDLRPFCADRPGLGTPACTIDPGRVVAELGLLDWSREEDPATRTETLIAGDALIRVGLTPSLEAQIGWTAFGDVRTRDRLSGATARQSGVGDVTLALRQNFSHPDGSGFSAAAMPFVTLPSGGGAIGAGDWGAGLVLPLSYSLSDTISIALTPEVDAAVDADGHGRHLAYGSVIGLSVVLTSHLSTAIELQESRDYDPAGHSTQALAGLSFAWQPRDDLQFDLGGVAGLNAASPDVELYIGVARRF